MSMSYGITEAGNKRAFDNVHYVNRFIGFFVARERRKKLHNLTFIR